MPKSSDPTHTKNPKRVAAGKRNRSLRRGLTAGGVRRLRDAALMHQPWTHSTGPKTAAGKQKVSQNGRWRQTGQTSKRQLRAELASVCQLARDLAKARKELLEQASGMSMAT